MAILNITFNGLSADYHMDMDHHMSDRDIRRVAAEVVRAGDVRGLHVHNLRNNAFDNYVVDRIDSGRGTKRIYLRPKVPFGA